jgi:predicted O-methyltransferase YrrM
MFYELRITLKTLRQEGVGAVLFRLKIYFRHLFAGLCFLVSRRPQNTTSETLVDFSLDTALGLIRPQQVRSEILRLARLVEQKRPQTVLEIGTANGGTLFLWCALAQPTASVTSIDLPGGIHGGGYPFWKTFLYRTFTQKQQHLTLMRANSQSPNTLAELKSQLNGRKIDFLFLDGDHTYNGIKADFENYHSLVAKGGMIAFHDICASPPGLNCQVDKFWNDIRKDFRHEEFIENPDQGWAGIGVLHVT